jgi:hypothetical protein
VEDTSIEGRIILKWIFKKWGGAGAGLMCFGIGTDDAFFECGNEPSVSITCGEFLDQLRTY